MRAPDERVDGDVRLRHGAQAAHLAEVVDAQLHHCRAVLRPDAEERQRHAQLVVEILLRLERVILLREHGGAHLLGRGLAAAARDAPIRISIRAGDLRHGRAHVVHQYHRPRHALRHMRRQAAGRALFQRGAHVFVPVARSPGSAQNISPGPASRLSMTPLRAARPCPQPATRPPAARAPKKWSYPSCVLLQRGVDDALAELGIAYPQHPPPPAAPGSWASSRAGCLSPETTAAPRRRV